MSLVNVFVNPARAVICADTEAGPDGGPYGEVSKLVPLPHMNAVIAARGSVLLLAGVVTAAVAMGGSFDELAQQMPYILKLASDKAVGHAENLAPAGTLSSEEAGCGDVALVGFSPSRGRVVAHHFIRATLSSEPVANTNIVQFVAPSWPDVDLGLDALRADPSREGMKALALAQVRLCRDREKPGMAAGGRLIYAEVSRDGIRVETLLAFPVRHSLSSADAV